MPSDRLPAALADLDPGNRALLDLSLRRGVSDAEIGELLRKTPEDVARGRDAVLELLADALEVPGADRRERVRRAVSELPDDAWRGGSASAEPQPEPEPEPEPSSGAEASPVREREPAREPLAPDTREPQRMDDFYVTPEPRRSRKGAAIAVLGLLAVGAAAAVLLLGGGGEEDEPAPDASDRAGSQPAPAPDQGSDGGRGVALTPLKDRGRGRVTAAEGGLLVISIRGLPRPDGAYEAWLYNTVVDAESLGRFEGANGRLQGRLPGGASRYRFLDISLEPADGNPNHSGESVLRVRLRDVAEVAR